MIGKIVCIPDIPKIYKLDGDFHSCPKPIPQKNLVPFQSHDKLKKKIPQNNELLFPSTFLLCVLDGICQLWWKIQYMDHSMPTFVEYKPKDDI